MVEGHLRRPIGVPAALVAVLLALLLVFAAQGQAAHTSPTVIATVPVGTAPGGVGVNPTTDRVYVANSTSNSVSVIDGVTNAVKNFISVAANPRPLGVNPVTNKIYVGHGTFFGRTQITVIDGATNAVSNCTTVGLEHDDIAVNPVTDLIYVSRGSKNSVSVIDGACNPVIATVGVPGRATGVGVNPTTDRVYVVNGTGNSVSAIDGVTNLVTATVPVGSSPQRVGVNPTTDRVYVVNGTGNSVSVIADIADVAVEKDIRSTDANFTPIDPETGAPLPAELGAVLDTAHDDHFGVSVQVHPKKGSVQNTNPGQLYGVLSISGPGLESLWFHDEFDDQFDVNPAQLGGGIEVVVIDAGGFATVLTDILKDVLEVEVTVDNTANTIWLNVPIEAALGRALDPGETLMIYVKFRPSPDFKGQAAPLFPDHWENWGFVDLDHDEEPDVDAHATVHLDAKR